MYEFCRDITFARVSENKDASEEVVGECILYTTDETACYTAL